MRKEREFGWRRRPRATRACARWWWCQAVVATQWVWSLSRLWVAATNRHSDWAAALPLRMNLSIRRLYLICPKIGSTVILR